MKINFDKGLIPAIAQDTTTGKVLMLGYMNEEALQKTKREGKVTFFSRSKERLWTKGEASGNFLYVEKILEDCDNDTVLLKVRPVGPVCHTGDDTCFRETNDTLYSFIAHLREIILERKLNPKEGSYTSTLFKEGVTRIAKKVGEEATEVVIEAMANNKERLKAEAADLFFHYLVLLEQCEVSFDEVLKILEGRNGR